MQIKKKSISIFGFDKSKLSFIEFGSYKRTNLSTLSIFYIVKKMGLDLRLSITKFLLVELTNTFVFYLFNLLIWNIDYWANINFKSINHVMLKHHNFPISIMLSPHIATISNKGRERAKMYNAIASKTNY